MAHEVFAIHLKGMQRHRGACIGLMLCTNWICRRQCEFRVYGACRDVRVAVWLLFLQSMRSCKRAADMVVIKDFAYSLSYLILFRFSWESFKKIIYKRFPVLNWLFSYQFREWILKDLHAGLNVGLVQVPQGRQREKKKHTCFLLYNILFIMCMLSCSFRCHWIMREL